MKCCMAANQHDLQTWIEMDGKASEPSDLRFRLVQKLDVPQYVPQLIWMIQINRWIVIDRSMRIFIGK